MISYHQPYLSTNRTVYGYACNWTVYILGQLKGQLTPHA